MYNQMPTLLFETYPYKAHPWTATKFVIDLERRAHGTNTWLGNCGWLPVVDGLLRTGVMPRVPTPKDPMIAFHLQMTAQEVATHELWARWRVVQEIHPGLTQHLRTSDSDKFPPLVLANILHPNPAVYLAEPVDMADPAGKPTRLLGWYTAGMTRAKRYCDTTDPAARFFHLTMISEVLSSDRSQVIDWDMSRVTIPITGADATVGEIITNVLDRFQWDPTIQGQSADFQRAFMSDLLHVAVPHLLYLASQGLDSQPKEFRAPAPPKGKSWERKARGGGKVARQLVGFRVGPALASVGRWDEPAGEGESRGPQGGRRSPVAHVRRAHFHRYLTGPRDGDQKTVVKWLAPIPINANGSPVGTTIVKIK
ncbi:MAG: hypothetical protein JWN15_3474 [Firmicutes bacterium]|nr:hypothetical protein [Bacillota bacterium]